MRHSDDTTEFNHVKNTRDDWEEYRDLSDKYESRKTSLPLLNCKKNILFLKEGKEREYEMLQCSRGITIKEDQKTIDDLIKYIEDSEMALGPQDLIRAKDLEIEIDINKVKSVVEMGFRVPKLLKHYRDRGVENVKGYDIVNLNVNAASKMGFDVEQRDFNNLENLDLSDFKDADLVLSYHMLEHVSRPDLLLEKLFESMKSGAYLHVEVPIEVDGPHLEHGHLFPFHPEELARLAHRTGFSLISAVVPEWVRDTQFVSNSRCQGYHYGDPKNTYERYGTQRVYNYQYLVLDQDYRDQFGAQHPPKSVTIEEWLKNRLVAEFGNKNGDRYKVIVPAGHPGLLIKNMYTRNNGFSPTPWMERLLVVKP